MKNRTEIIDYINALTGYQGYVQFSDRSIEDVWQEFSDIHVAPKAGFVYEAHFYNGTESIAIRQLNANWFVCVTDISSIHPEEINTYHGKTGKVKMAQVWEEERDPLCEEMPVKRLTKVVFAGFDKGEVQ